MGDCADGAATWGYSSYWVPDYSLGGAFWYGPTGDWANCDNSHCIDLYEDAGVGARVLTFPCCQASGDGQPWLKIGGEPMSPNYQVFDGSNAFDGHGGTPID